VQREDFRRDRNVVAELRQLLFEEVAGPLLVAVVDEGEEITDGDRAEFSAPDLSGNAPDVVLC
jgi:hypothetical protein